MKFIVLPLVHVIWTDDRDQKSNSNRESYYKRDPTGNTSLQGGAELRSKTCDAMLKILQNPASCKDFKIQYSILRESKVKLVIYNPLGQAEEVLVAGEARAGVYEEMLNKRLDNGIYFVIFEANGKRITEKVVVIN